MKNAYFLEQFDVIYIIDMIFEHLELSQGEYGQVKQRITKKSQNRLIFMTFIAILIPLNSILALYFDFYNLPLFKIHYICHVECLNFLEMGFEALEDVINLEIIRAEDKSVVVLLIS